MKKGLLGIVVGFVLLYLGIEAEIGMMAIFGGFFLLAGCVSLGLNLGESSNKKSKTQTSSANKTPPRSEKPKVSPVQPQPVPPTPGKTQPKVSPVQPQPVPPTPGRQPDPPVVKPQPASAAPAVRRCKHCGAAVAQDDYYCIECGYPA